MERLEIRMPLAQETRLLLRRRPRAVHQEAQRVAVPGREVQVGGERMMVEAARPPHEVVEDRGIGTPADLVALDAVETRHLIGAEPAERQDVGRIRLGDGAAGQPDPVEAVVLHGPEHVPPRAVQRLDGPVAPRAPCPERGERIPGIAERGVVAAVFVVRLPGHDVRVPAVALGEQPGDAAAFLAVSVMAEAVVAAGAEPARRAPGAGREHAGVPVQHPAGGRRGGRPQHDPQPRRPQRLDRPVQPVEPERPGAGLDA